GQRDNFITDASYDRALRLRKLSERGLLRNRYRIMNECLDAAGSQMPLQDVALGRSDHEEMIHMAWVALLERINRRFSETGAILIRELPTALGRSTKSRQTGIQDCCLDLIQSGIDSLLLMMVPIGLSSIP